MGDGDDTDNIAVFGALWRSLIVCFFCNGVLSGISAAGYNGAGCGGCGRGAGDRVPFGLPRCGSRGGALCRLYRETFLFCIRGILTFTAVGAVARHCGD